MKIIAVDDEEIALENLESAIHEAKPSAEVAAFDKSSAALVKLPHVATVTKDCNCLSSMVYPLLFKCSWGVSLYMPLYHSFPGFPTKSLHGYFLR